jgi:hypothetical protein
MLDILFFLSHLYPLNISLGSASFCFLYRLSMIQLFMKMFCLLLAGLTFYDTGGFFELFSAIGLVVEIWVSCLMVNLKVRPTFFWLIEFID